LHQRFWRHLYLVGETRVIECNPLEDLPFAASPIPWFDQTRVPNKPIRARAPAPRSVSKPSRAISGTFNVVSGKPYLLKVYSPNLAMPLERKTIFFSIPIAYFEMRNGICLARKDRVQHWMPNKREVAITAPVNRSSM
jgi:hypothetical protein